MLENSHVISGLISIYGGTEDDPRHLYVETGEAPEDWEIWIDVYNDDLAEVEAQAERRANNILNDRKRPYTTNLPSILLNPDQVTLITAGQAIEVKSVVMNQGALQARVGVAPHRPDQLGAIGRRALVGAPRARPAAWLTRRGWAAASRAAPAPTRRPSRCRTPATASRSTTAATIAGRGRDQLDRHAGNRSTGGRPRRQRHRLRTTSSPTRPTSYQTTWAASGRLDLLACRATSAVTSDGAAAAGLHQPGGRHRRGTVGARRAGRSTPACRRSSPTMSTRHEWTAFSAGPFDRPDRHHLGGTGRGRRPSTSTRSFIYLVADPVANDEFAIDFGDYPHDSPFYLPSDYVESRLDELQSQISALPETIQNGLTWKAPARVATTASGTLATCSRRRHRRRCDPSRRRSILLKDQGTRHQEWHLHRQRLRRADAGHRLRQQR